MGAYFRSFERMHSLKSVLQLLNSNEDSDGVIDSISQLVSEFSDATCRDTNMPLRRLRRAALIGKQVGRYLMEWLGIMLGVSASSHCNRERVGDSGPQPSASPSHFAIAPGHQVMLKCAEDNIDRMQALGQMHMNNEVLFRSCLSVHIASSIVKELDAYTFKDRTAQCNLLRRVVWSLSAAASRGLHDAANSMISRPFVVGQATSTLQAHRIRPATPCLHTPHPTQAANTQESASTPESKHVARVEVGSSSMAVPHLGGLAMDATTRSVVTREAALFECSGDSACQNQQRSGVANEAVPARAVTSSELTSNRPGHSMSEQSLTRMRRTCARIRGELTALMYACKHADSLGGVSRPPVELHADSDTPEHDSHADVALACVVRELWPRLPVAHDLRCLAIAQYCLASAAADISVGPGSGDPTSGDTRVGQSTIQIAAPAYPSQSSVGAIRDSTQSGDDVQRNIVKVSLGFALSLARACSILESRALVGAACAAPPGNCACCAPVFASRISTLRGSGTVQSQLLIQYADGSVVLGCEAGDECPAEPWVDVPGSLIAPHVATAIAPTIQSRHHPNLNQEKWDTSRILEAKTAIEHAALESLQLVDGFSSPGVQQISPSVNGSRASLQESIRLLGATPVDMGAWSIVNIVRTRVLGIGMRNFQPSGALVMVLGVERSMILLQSSETSAIRLCTLMRRALTLDGVGHCDAPGLPAPPCVPEPAAYPGLCHQQNYTNRTMCSVRDPDHWWCFSCGKVSSECVKLPVLLHESLRNGGIRVIRVCPTCLAHSSQVGANKSEPYPVDDGSGASKGLAVISPPGNIIRGWFTRQDTQAAEHQLRSTTRHGHSPPRCLFGAAMLLGSPAPARMHWLERAMQFVSCSPEKPASVMAGSLRATLAQAMLLTLSHQFDFECSDDFTELTILPRPEEVCPEVGSSDLARARHKIVASSMVVQSQQSPQLTAAMPEGDSVSASSSRSSHWQSTRRHFELIEEVLGRTLQKIDLSRTGCLSVIDMAELLALWAKTGLEVISAHPRYAALCTNDSQSKITTDDRCISLNGAALGRSCTDIENMPGSQCPTCSALLSSRPPLVFHGQMKWQYDVYEAASSVRLGLRQQQDVLLVDRSSLASEGWGRVCARCRGDGPRSKLDLADWHVAVLPPTSIRPSFSQSIAEEDTPTVMGAFRVDVIRGPSQLGLQVSRVFGSGVGANQDEQTNAQQQCDVNLAWLLDKSRRMVWVPTRYVQTNGGPSTTSVQVVPNGGSTRQCDAATAFECLHASTVPQEMPHAATWSNDLQMLTDEHRPTAASAESAVNSIHPVGGATSPKQTRVVAGHGLEHIEISSDDFDWTA